MSDEEIMTITDDTFVAQLVGDSSLRLPKMTPGQKSRVYAVVVEYVRQKGSIVGRPADIQRPNELPLKIPGTALIIRLSRPNKEELSALVALCVGLGVSIELKDLALTALVAAAARMSKLRSEYGERSIVEVIVQAGRATEREIVLALYGKACRYPKANCQFLAKDGTTCALSFEQVSVTLSKLIDQEVIRVMNAVPPKQFALAV